MECNWGHNRKETHLCGPAEFILAFICDKCGDKRTLDMCPYHLTSWKDKYGSLRCTVCGGTLSWEARNLNNGQKEWHVNKGPDDN